jgi:hypothetical protein
VDVPFTVTVTAAVCDCADQPWIGSGDTATAPVGSTTPHTLPLPTVDTAGMDATPQLRQCLSANSCLTSGSFTAADLGDGVPLESWIGWSNGDTALSLAPTSGGQNGPYAVRVTFTPDEGSPVTYTATDVTVTCTIASIASPSAPTTGLSYDIF